MSLHKVLSVGLASFLLVSCLGTEAKKLNTSTTTSTSTNTDVESFSVTVAYRKDVSPDDGRLVVMQGVRGIASASLATNCGTTGVTCQCLFYTSTTDTNPAVGVSAANGMSTGNNSLSCTIPGAVDPDNYTKVRLKTTDGLKSTGFINISTSLTLTDVLGNLAVNKVRGIMRYSCVRTFLEGEGVSANAITCPNSQNLGLLFANYTYYLYSSTLGNNFSQKGSDVAWESTNGICGYTQSLKLRCTSSVVELRYGLYAEQTGIFQVPITMVANGVSADARSIYGYAAQTDTAGNCPTGLVKISQWEAQPPSLTQGSVPPGLLPEFPTSFINQANNLNDKMVEDATTAPSPFVVTYQTNATACSAVDGSCASITLDPPNTFPGTSYTQLTPIVCAIPKALVSSF